VSQKNRSRELERRQKAGVYHYPRYVLKLLRLITNKEFIRALARQPGLLAASRAPHRRGCVLAGTAV